MDFTTIIEYFTSLDVDVLLPFGIFIILLIVPWGADIWQNIFTVVFGLKGVGLLLFPQYFARFMILDKVDALHLQEIRCLGIILLTDFLSNVLTRKSNDPTVKSIHLWSRTLYLGLYTMLSYATGQLSTDHKKNNLNLKMFELGMPMLYLVFGGHLYYSMTKSDWGGHTEPGRTCRQFHIRVNFLIWFLHGLLTYVFPVLACQFQTTLAGLDTAHTFLARAMGAGFLTISLVALRTANFFSEEDKKSVLLAHGIGNLLFLMTMAFCQMFTKVFSEWHLYYGMSFVAITAFNALIACDLSNMVKLAKIQIKNYLVTKED